MPHHEATKLKTKPTWLMSLLMALACMGLLVSCGGGGGGATTINGISVPPEPDATQNNATLAGVDSNSNGVRDDVERSIAEKATSPVDDARLLKIASAYQRITSETTLTDVELKDLYGDINCAVDTSVNKFTESDISKLIINNEARDLKFKKNTEGFSYFSDELKACN